MKLFNKVVSVFLATLMLVAALPLGVFASGNLLAESTLDNGDFSGDYWLKYTFDKANVGTAYAQGSLDTFGESDSNPYGLSMCDGLFDGLVKAHADGNGNYLSFKYGAKTTGNSWKGIQLSLVNGDEDYSIANGVEISFKFRWLGAGEGATHSMGFVRVRRRPAGGGNATINELLAASVDQTTGNLNIKDQKGNKIYTLTKGSSDFTDFKVTYHDVSNTYSVYINGTPYVEAVKCSNDARTSTFVTTTYDDDFISTKTCASGLTKKESVELFRIDDSNKNWATTSYAFDMDSLVIREGDYYKNTFTTAKTGYNTFTGSSVTSSSVASSIFALNNNASSAGVSIGSETVNGVTNNYLALTNRSRIDFQDTTYQFADNGNWTVDFKFRATASKKVDFLRFNDTLTTSNLLYVDANGVLYLGGHQIPGVTIPKANANSSDWTRITLSVLVDDTYKGVYDDFAGNTTNTGRYRVALWVDGKYVDVGYLNRVKLKTDNGRLINGHMTAETAIAGMSDIPATAVLVDDSNGINTYKDTNGTLYQVKCNADGSFASGVKITVTANANNWNLIGFGTKDADGITAAHIDDLSIYRGVGPKEYANGKLDNTGVISEVEFSRLLSTTDHYVAENVSGANPGVFFMMGLGTKAGTSGGDFREWVTATASNPGYVKAQNNGYIVSAADLNAAYSGGKVFAAELTLKGFGTYASTDAQAVDIPLLTLMRQNKGDAAATTATSLYAEITTGYLYFKIGEAKHYLCNNYGDKYYISSSDWDSVIRAVYDESGSETLVSFYINGDRTYYVRNGKTFPANDLSGVITDVYDLKDATEQRVRFYYANKTKFTMNLVSAKVEYAIAEVIETKEYSDFVAVDFSDFESIDAFKEVYGDQYICTEGVYIEDGVLKIPAGESFGWIDFNGEFVDYLKTHAVDPTNKYRFNGGYAIEAKLKAADTLSGLLSLSYDNLDVDLVQMQDGRICTLDAVSGYIVNDLKSDRFSNISLLFTNFAGMGNKATVFADGKLVGVVGYEDDIAVTEVTGEAVAFMFADNTEIAELYIHRDQQRILAIESGDIFELDPDVFLPKDNAITSYPAAIKEDGSIQNGMATGVLDSDTHALVTYGTILNDEKYGNYYSLNMVKSADEITDTNNAVVVKGQSWNDIIVTGYLEDKVTVFEYDLRFTPHKNASTSNAIQILGTRRTEDGTTSSVSENLLAIREDGRLAINNNSYIICNEDGSNFYLPKGEWVNIAVVYDANSGKVGYVVDGKILHYKNGSGVVQGLANDIQLPTARYYRMDAADTKIRFLNIPSAGTVGKLDIAGFKIYNTDGTANAGYVGAQIDTHNNNIRIVAGVDMLYYESVGFEVEAFDADGISIADIVKSYKSDIVYSSINETIEDNIYTVYPETFGYRYFYTASIDGIPEDKAVKLNVTPFTEINGTRYKSSTVTLDIDFTATSMNDWILKTDSVEVKPEGTTTSKDANFSTTEIVSYTNDGALEFNGLDAKFAFAANLDGGVVSVNLTNSKGEVSECSKFDIYVDDFTMPKATVQLDFGHHTLVLAEDLVGDHKFMIVKRSGGDFVCINNMSVNGTITMPPELAVEGAVEVKVSAPANGADYGTVNAYVRTSDTSNKYYINYKFNYIDWAENNSSTYGSDGSNGVQHNAQMYRIDTATLVEKTDTGYKNVFQILQGGEVSLAIKENWQGTAAADFVGGYHGDENIENGQIYMYIDGNELDLTISGTYTGTHFVFDQTTIINRCNIPQTDVMRHKQYMLLDTNGLRNNQSVEFLVADFQPDTTQTYLQMCTFNRQNMSLSASERVKPENYLCSELKLLNANGAIISEHDLSTHKVEDGTSAVGNNSTTRANNRYVEYFGNDNGLYGKVGFIIDDYSVKAERAFVMVREPQGDNKWYASFMSHNSSSTVVTIPVGEVWNISDYYYFDYNTTN